MSSKYKGLNISKPMNLITAKQQSHHSGSLGIGIYEKYQKDTLKRWKRLSLTFMLLPKETKGQGERARITRYNYYQNSVKHTTHIQHQMPIQHLKYSIYHNHLGPRMEPTVHNRWQNYVTAITNRQQAITITHQLYPIHKEKSILTLVINKEITKKQERLLTKIATIQREVIVYREIVKIHKKALGQVSTPTKSIVIRHKEIQVVPIKTQIQLKKEMLVTKLIVHKNIEAIASVGGMSRAYLESKVYSDVRVRQNFFDRWIERNTKLQRQTITLLEHTKKDNRFLASYMDFSKREQKEITHFMKYSRREQRNVQNFMEKSLVIARQTSDFIVHTKRESKSISSFIEQASREGKLIHSFIQGSKKERKETTQLIEQLERRQQAFWNFMNRTKRELKDIGVLLVNNQSEHTQLHQHNSKYRKEYMQLTTLLERKEGTWQGTSIRHKRLTQQQTVTYQAVPTDTVLLVKPEEKGRAVQAEVTTLHTVEKERKSINKEIEKNKEVENKETIRELTKEQINLLTERVYQRIESKIASERRRYGK